MIGVVWWVLWPLCNLGQAPALLWAYLLCSSVKGDNIPGPMASQSYCEQEVNLGTHGGTC